MTELATPPAERSRTSSASATGSAARASPARRAARARSTTRPPASRPARSTSPSVEEVDARGRRPPRRRSRPGARRRCRSAPEMLFRDPRARRTSAARSSPRILTAEHGKVLSDALGEVARGLEVIEFACGIPHLLKGGFSEQASTGVDVYSIRQPLGVVAGITPFNFPAMVPDVDVGAARSRAATRSSSSRPRRTRRRRSSSPSCCKEAGLPDGVFNVVHGDKVAVDAHPRAPGHRRGQLRRLDADRALHLRDRHAARQARAGARRREEPHDRAARRRHRHGRRRGGLAPRYGSAGERCMAISVVVAVGDVGRPAGRRDQGAAAEDQGRRRASSPASEMGPLDHARAPRQGRRRYIDSGAGRRARRSSSTAARRAPDGDGFFLGVSLLDNVTPEMDAYTRRDLRAGARRSSRVDTYDEAVELVNDNPYGNGTAIFTRDGGAARQFQFEVEAGMVGINVPIPVPVAYYSFGGWKASLFGDTHMYGPRGHPLLHARQGRHLALARPGDEPGRPGLPADPLVPRALVPSGFVAHSV